MENIPTILPKQITDKYDIVSNTFIGKDKGEVKGERQVEIGDAHSDDFQPQAKLTQWENETNFSVRLKHTERNATIETEGDKVKWKGKKIEAHFYDVPKTKNLPKAFELEILLLEKPKTNKVEFTTQSKGLKFYYQPELTQEERDEGAFRPENVIGSYAVYHESKQGDYSKMGLKNYRAGKAFHIYRPKVIDSAGKEVWGKLNIKNNLLTVEIPQEFLDNAVYPVRHAAGLTFGYETAGTTGGSAIGVYGPYRTLFTSDSSAGTADKITVSIYTGASYNAKAAIYSGNSVITNGITNEVAINNVSQSWEDLTYTTKPSISASAQYYLALGAEGGSYYYDVGDANQSSRDTTAYGTFPDPWNADASYARKYSIYCTYTAGGATEKEVTDVGSGADAVSIKCQTSITDSGAGADTAAILASMNLTDTGSGVDTISIAQLKSLLETGSGADIISLIAKLNVVDTGAGSEVISLLGQIAQTDTGAGSEALSVLSQLATITDTGSGVDALTILVGIALTDTGAGAEALSILYKNAITDTGVGSEIISILNQLILTDTGTGADVADKTILGSDKQVTDSGTGSEALSVLTQLAVTDSGTGAEAVNALIKLSVLDNGTGSEIVGLLLQVAQTDSGSGSEALEILRQIAVTETGTASEALTVLVQLAVTETGSGADEITVSGEGKFIQDSGSGSEALNILIGMSITDSGVGGEILDILNQIVLTDTASGADAITAIGQFVLTDSGNGSEAIGILASIAVSDSGLGTEALDVLKQMSITDSGTGIEILSVLNQIAQTDTGSGADIISKTALDTRYISDSGTGADVVAFAKQLVLQDSGVGTDSVFKQKITAAIATILSALDKNANIKSTGQNLKSTIKSANQVKAKIKKIINN